MLSVDDNNNILEIDTVTAIEPIEGLNTGIDVVITAITDIATKINTPEETGNFTIINKSDSTVYIKGSSVTTSTGVPLEKNESIPCREFKRYNSNAIYGICAAGNTANIYVIGSIV